MSPVNTIDRFFFLGGGCLPRQGCQRGTKACGEKTRPGLCPERQVIARRPSMINQAREVFCQGRCPASLIYVSTVTHRPLFRRLLCRFPGRQVVPGTALLPCSFLLPSAKETICDFPSPDGSVLHGNGANIAARLAAATILQPGSASTDILL